jgi:hypothetical protein
VERAETRGEGWISLTLLLRRARVYLVIGDCVICKPEKDRFIGREGKGREGEVRRRHRVGGINK